MIREDERSSFSVKREDERKMGDNKGEAKKEDG